MLRAVAAGMVVRRVQPKAHHSVGIRCPCDDHIKIPWPVVRGAEARSAQGLAMPHEALSWLAGFGFRLRHGTMAAV